VQLTPNSASDAHSWTSWRGGESSFVARRCAVSRGKRPAQDVDVVVEAADAAGLAHRVARLEPIICIKG